MPSLPKPLRTKLETAVKLARTTAEAGARAALLKEVTWKAVARLGPRAFETISGEVVSRGFKLQAERDLLAKLAKRG